MNAEFHLSERDYQKIASIVVQTIRDEFSTPQPPVISLNEKDAARAIGISSNVLGNLRREGKIPGATKVGSRWIYTVQVLRDLIETGDP